MIRLATQPESDPLEGADIMSYRLLSPVQLHARICDLNKWHPGLDVDECTLNHIVKSLRKDYDHLLIDLEISQTVINWLKTPLLKRHCWYLRFSYLPEGNPPYETVPGSKLTIGEENARRIAQRANRLGVQTKFVNNDIRAEINGPFSTITFFRLCFAFVLLDHNYPKKFNLQEFISDV